MYIQHVHNLYVTVLVIGGIGGSVALFTALWYGTSMAVCMYALCSMPGSRCAPLCIRVFRWFVS